MIFDLLYYVFKFSLSLGLFWVVYRIFIKKETNIIFNRYYLLLTIIFSLLVPAITISIPFSSSEQIIPHSILSKINIDKIAPKTSISKPELTKSEAVIIAPTTIKLEEHSKTEKHWKFAVKWVYFIVSSLLILHLIIQLIRTTDVILKSERKKVNGFSLFVNHNVKSPYSFLQYIIINPQLYSSKVYQQIIAHETEHCKQMHFVEMALIEMLKPILWFIPFIWFYEKEIKENHEYLADYAVLNQGFNKQSYQQTLLNGSFGMQYLGIVSFLHKSFIKKRIVMMTNHNSKKFPKWKLLLLAPVVLIGLLSFSNKTTIPKDTININIDFSEHLKLNKAYQFISRIDGNFFCRGTYTFNSIDNNGIWQGIQSNFTQDSELAVTAKVSKNTIEIYTDGPWGETWKIYSIEKEMFKGVVIGDYSLAQNTNITFELRESINISELMPEYSPKSKELIYESIPFLKNEKYYWELWDDKTQTSSLSGWFNFENYNSITQTLSGTQFNYRTNSHTKFTGSYIDDKITINIGAPWDSVWTAEIQNNIYIGLQSYDPQSKYFKKNEMSSWRMSSRPFEDRLKVFRF